MKVLLTGHRGYLGTNLLWHLEKNGHDILAIDCKDSPSSDIRFIRPTDFVLGASKGLLNDYGLWHPDVIVNFAGLSGVRACADSSDDAQFINAEGPARLAMLWGAPLFIQASTATVLSPDESVYRTSKLQAEENLKEVAHLRDGFTLICRFGTVFGLSPEVGLKNFRWDLPLHHMIRTAKHSHKIELSNGDAVRPWLSIQRLCSVLMDLIENGLPGTGPDDEKRWHVLEFAEFNHPFRTIANLIQPHFDCAVHHLPGTESKGYSFKELLNTVPGAMEEEIKKLVATDIPPFDFVVSPLEKQR